MFRLGPNELIELCDRLKLLVLEYQLCRDNQQQLLFGLVLVGFLKIGEDGQEGEDGEVDGLGERILCASFAVNRRLPPPARVN